MPHGQAGDAAAGTEAVALRGISPASGMLTVGALAAHGKEGQKCETHREESLSRVTDGGDSDWEGTTGGGWPLPWGPLRGSRWEGTDVGVTGGADIRGRRLLPWGR